MAAEKPTFVAAGFGSDPGSLHVSVTLRALAIRTNRGVCGADRLASDAARMLITEPSWIGAVAGEQTRTAIDTIVHGRAWPLGQVRVCARAVKYAENIPASSCELTVIRYNPRKRDVAMTERSRHFFRGDGSRVAAHLLA